MQDFNNLTYTTSDQHKEATDARLNRNIDDLDKINSRLIPFTPFSDDRSLRNIVTGIEAPSDTNVHKYKAVGINIINTMVSQAAFQYYFELKDRTKNLGVPGDADFDIVKTVADSSHQHSTTLIGEDTDLLKLLLHYADTDPDIKYLYFRFDKTCATKVHDINRLKAIIGPDICSQLLFIHAFTSCDSTSRIFGIGKKTAFKKLVKGQPITKKCADCFILLNQTDHIIKNLGNKAMTVMFGNDGSSNLETLRCNTLVKNYNSQVFCSP